MGNWILPNSLFRKAVMWCKMVGTERLGVYDWADITERADLNPVLRGDAMV